LYPLCRPIEPGDPVPCLPADGDKRTANDDLAVRLNGDGVDIVVCIGIEGFICCAVRIEPGDIVSCLPSDGGKITTHKDLTVRLNGDGIDIVACIGIEGRIRCAVRIETGDPAPCLPPTKIKEPPTMILPSD